MGSLLRKGSLTSSYIHENTGRSSMLSSSCQLENLTVTGLRPKKTNWFPK